MIAVGIVQLCIGRTYVFWWSVVDGIKLWRVKLFPGPKIYFTGEDQTFTEPFG